jgi:hypothetical protein
VTAATARPLLSIGEIAGMLAGRAEALARELLPDGKRHGPEWVAPSRWGGTTRSLSVHLSGQKAGVWRDFATGDMGGDALDLVAQIACAGDKGRAVRWARAWLGLDDMAPGQMEARRRQAQVAAAEASAQAKEAAERHRRQAQALWLAAQEIAGTPADLYLSGRGIRLAALGAMPRALRFHPALFNAETKSDLPAMVAAIADAAGKHIATHRTYLQPDGKGGWRKAALRTAKTVLGSYAGGFIRLSRGASGKPWGELRGTDTVAMAEGIENALSVAMLVPEWRCAAAVAVANMGAIDLPDACRDLVVCADNDAPDSAAVVTLQNALVRLAASGRRVRVARPDPGIKDWNDQLRAELASVEAP